MNAYNVLKRKLPKQIDECFFNTLIKEFRESYFKENKYYERIANDWIPTDFIDELLNGEFGTGLYTDLHKIQYRDEMRDVHANVSSFVHHTVYKIWRKNKNLRTRYNAIKEFCKVRKRDFNTTAIHIAEYKAMEQVLHFLIRAKDRLYQKRFIPPKEIVNPKKIIASIIEFENKFCKGMPIKFAIEHFKVFIEKNNNYGKRFLTEEQFISFLKRAFLNDNSVGKTTLNVGSREKSFVVKRFYEFYTLAANRFENTSQCRDKYIMLLTDNFDNWSYNEIKNNFKNKTKRNW